MDLFSLCHSTYISLPQWKLELKNVYSTFFNGLLNKISKKSKIMEIYSLQMNRHLLYAQWKMKKKITSLSSTFLREIIIMGYGFLQNHSHILPVISKQKLILHDYKYFRTNTKTSTGFCILVSHTVPNNNRNHKILCAGYQHSSMKRHRAFFW